MLLNFLRARANRIFFVTMLSLLAIASVGCGRNTSSDGEVVDIIQALHEKLRQGTADSMNVWLNELKSLHRAASVPDSLLAQTHYYHGRYFYQKGELDSATTLLHQAITLIRPPITKKQTEYFRLAWSAYSARGEYGECIALSNTLEDLIGVDGTPKQKALLYFFRENAYRQQGDLEQAYHYNDLHIEQLELVKDMEGLASALMFKAFYAYYVEEDVDETFAILDTLVARGDQYSNNLNRLIHGDYGVYLFIEGNYQGALDAYQKGLMNVHKMQNEAERSGYFATSYSNIAEAYMELGDLESAQIFLDSVFQIGLNGIPEDIRNNTLRYQLELIYRDRRGLQPIKNALDSIVWYQDQQFLQRNQSELKALQLANEKEKALLEKNKEEELKNLRLRSLQTLLLVSFAIIIWVGYLLYRQRQLRFEKQELQLHQRLLRTQMNPHFTFNTLYAIQTLIKRDPQKAVKYQLKFSRLLRVVLENSTANFVQLDDELNAVEQYLELQLLRFPEKFEYEILLEGVERDELIYIPPMLIQPMIENCIEHGFAGINHLGFISIKLAMWEKNLLFCTIEDNGQGIQSEEYHVRQAKSTELIDAFLKKLTPHGLKITNKAGGKAEEKGVLVEFFIPSKKTVNG